MYFAGISAIFDFLYKTFLGVAVNPAMFDINGLCTSQVFQPFLTFYIKRLGVAVNPATFDIKGLCTSQVFQPYLAFYIKRLGVAVNPATASAFQYWCLAYTLVYYHQFYPLK